MSDVQMCDKTSYMHKTVLWRAGEASKPDAMHTNRLRQPKPRRSVIAPRLILGTAGNMTSIKVFFKASGKINFPRMLMSSEVCKNSH